MIVNRQISQPQLDRIRTTLFEPLGLTKTQLAPLLTLVQEQHYDPKAFVLHAGDSWNKLYFIQSGLIRLFYADRKGREFNKSFFWEGHTIWPVAPRDRERGVLFEIAAIEETVILACPIRPIQATLQKYGVWEKFALPFAETLIEQKFQREHDLLLLSAKERYDNLHETHADVIGRIPDYHLASFLGITNVSFSRIKHN